MVNPGQIQQAAADLRLARNFTDKLKALRSLQGLLYPFSMSQIPHGIAKAPYKRGLWEEVKGVGLMSTLFDLSDRPVSPSDRTAVEACDRAVGLIYLITSYFEDAVGQDAEYDELVQRHGPTLFQRCTEIHYHTITSVEQGEDFRAALVRLASDWVVSRRDDKEFLLRFDPEIVLNYVYYIQFNPDCRILRSPTGLQIDSESYEFHLQREYTTLQRTFKLFHVYCNMGTMLSVVASAASSVVSKYGAVPIADRLHQLFLNERYAAWQLGNGTGYMVQCFSKIESFRKAADDSGLATSMLKNYWRVLQHNNGRTTEDGEPTVEAFHARIGYVMAAWCEIADENAQSICRTLLCEQDLLLLFASRIPSEGPGLNAQSNSFSQGSPFYLSVVAAARQDNLRWNPIITRPLQHILQTVRKIPNYPTALWDLWLGCVKKVYDMSPDTFILRLTAPDAESLGCYWVKCPSYRNQTSVLRRAMLTCSKCYLAKYCSPLCQRSDWREGGHRIICVSI